MYIGIIYAWIIDTIASYILQENKKASAVKAFTHFKIVKNPKAEEPLPNPFELPRNYPQDVMDELKQNRLSGRARL